MFLDPKPFILSWDELAHWTSRPYPPQRSDRLARHSTVARLREFSLIGDKRLTRKNSRRKREPDTPFSNALKRLEESKACLSTSPGASFSPPKVLLDLAQKEGVKPNRRLKGDGRASLSSILGWDCKAAQGKGISGILGFVHQQISVLVRPARSSCHITNSIA
jgi:1-phosphatidylinositol-3-phosphate 5-kinase